MNRYPTPEHQNAAEAIVEFFTIIPEIEAVCLICSCARGKASRDSCLDILVYGFENKLPRFWITETL